MFREDVTYHTCYEPEAELIEQVKQFERRLNAKPKDIADRLWVTLISNLDGVYIRFFLPKFDPKNRAKLS